MALLFVLKKIIDQVIILVMPKFLLWSLASPSNLRFRRNLRMGKYLSSFLCQILSNQELPKTSLRGCNGSGFCSCTFLSSSS